MVRVIKRSDVILGLSQTEANTFYLKVGEFLFESLRCTRVAASFFQETSAIERSVVGGFDFKLFFYFFRFVLERLQQEVWINDVQVLKLLKLAVLRHGTAAANHVGSHRVDFWKVKPEILFYQREGSLLPAQSTL